MPYSLGMRNAHLVSISVTFSVAVSLALLGTGCHDETDSAAVTGGDAFPRASFDLNGTIVGPDDDESDIELTLKESNGVAATLNFVRLTCSNRASSEWGADGFVSELGTNRIEGGTTLSVRRHYRCPSSGRPQSLLADLTDDHGVHYRVDGSPHFYLWPG
jgi:hypothetical protein